MPSSKPTHRHSFLSANSLMLREDDSVYGFSRRHLRLFVAGLVVLLLVVTFGWRFLTTSDSPYELDTVDESGFSFTVQFYKDAVIEKSHDTSYLTYHDPSGNDITLWATKIDKILSCGNNPIFDYSASGTIQVRSSCYRDDRTLYVAAVYDNNQYYQLNMTSQKPLNVDDAQTIFSSININ